MKKPVKHVRSETRPASTWKARWLIALALGAGVGAALWWVRTQPGDSPSAPASPPGGSAGSAAGVVPELDDAALEKALHAEAIGSIEALLAAFPDNDDAVFLAGLVHHELGDGARAVELWKRSMVIDPGRADARDRLGMALFKEDRYEEAERHFREALKLDPAQPAIRLHLANALFQQGRMEEVVSLLAGVPALPAKGWELLGGAYQQLRDYAKAREAFDAAVAIHPGSIDAHYALSQIHTRLGDAGRRAEHWERFEDLKRRADETARQERVTYSPLEATRKTVAKAQTDMGRVHLAYGGAGAAEALWRRAGQIDPENTECRFQLALLAQRRGDLAGAAALYAEIEKIAPNDPQLHLSLGHLNVRMNRLKQAAESYVAAIRLQPDEPAAYVALIELFLQTGAELDRARTLAEHCVGLAPTAGHHALLSRAWASNNNLSAALTAIDRALELEPGNQTFRQIRQGLQTGR